MKQIITTLIFALIIMSNSAQNLDFQWAAIVSGNWTNIGHSITTDNLGNIYNSGKIGGTSATFQTQSGTSILSGQGGYLQKLDQDGNLIWVRYIPNSGYSVATDDQLNVYVAGLFNGIQDFDPGSGVSSLTANGGNDIFLLKLDPNGNFVWVKHIGGASDDSASEVIVDVDQNICLTGTFSDVVDFDPGTGVFQLTSNGARDHYVLKLDSNGDFAWAVSAGGNYIDGGAAICSDLNGNVYTTGGFIGNVDFNPGTGVANLTSAGAASDIFIQKLDPNGNFIWACSMGGGTIDIGQSIKIDDDGHVYTTGYYKNTGSGVDFDPDPSSTFLLHSVGGQSDLFAQKLDSNGNFIWAKSIGGNSRDVGISLALDNLDGVFLTGLYADSVDFDPGSGVTQLVSNSLSTSDAFILKMNKDGDFVWVKSIGGGGIDEGHCISTDNCNDVYVTGYFSDTVDMDPGAGVNSVISEGSYDGYLLKLSTNQEPGVDSVSSCGPHTWLDGNTYTTSNNTAEYIISGGSVFGCDSIVKLNLTIEGDPEINLSYSIEPGCQGVGVEFLVDSDQIENIQWDFNNGQHSTEFKPYQVFPYGDSYTVNIHASKGTGDCEGDMDTTIVVGDMNDYFTLQSPNVFTPNGDGINDSFCIEVNDELSQCAELVIFNRWGQQLFNSSEKNGVVNGKLFWDGKSSNGNQAPDGTYFYLLKTGELEHQGTVSLMR